MRTSIIAIASCVLLTHAHAIDEERRARAIQMIDRAVEYLRAQQDPDHGGWAHNPRGPNLPAITGLVVTGMVLDPRIDASDPSVAAAINYILSFSQPDGGIYDRILPSYNTAICLSAIALARSPEAAHAIEPAQRFLIGLQFSEEAAVLGEAGATTMRVTREHPFYGGIGYGSGGRPDNSNLHFMLQALEDSGVSGDHPAVQRAVVFLERTQMLSETNDMPYAQGSTQGGFIYSTSPDGERIGEGESKAGLIDETLPDGRRVSRLRAYGSMTYAGFKSYIYANLAPDDPRVAAAFDWISRNYNLEENPGIGPDGVYYYYVTFARALDARRALLPGRDRRDAITVIDADGSTVARDWANDLVDRLAALQNEDGSFRSMDSRWMEDNPVLITAYSLIALQHAVR